MRNNMQTTYLERAMANKVMELSSCFSVYSSQAHAR